MNYESVVVIESRVAPDVSFTVTKMSYGRRVDLMRQICELARRKEFLEASERPADKMDTALLEAEINRLYFGWGLKAISGLIVDGVKATPEVLAENGPESLFREALTAVRHETGLTEAERKN